MTDKTSLLQGKRWYWRQGFRRIPMNHFQEYWLFETKELYTPVTDEAHATQMMEELKNAGIETEMKTTHSHYDVVPSGSLIVYAALSRGSDKTEKEKEAEDQNIEKLKAYITSKGGEIGDVRKKNDFSIKKFFSNLFGKGR